MSNECQLKQNKQYSVEHGDSPILLPWRRLYNNFIFDVESQIFVTNYHGNKGRSKENFNIATLLADAKKLLEYLNINSTVPISYILDRHLITYRDKCRCQC